MDTEMTMIDILNSGANVNLTISAADLREFFEEVVKDTTEKEKAAEVERNADTTMTQTQVCRYLGISKSTLWRWEQIGYLVPSGRMGKRPQYLRSAVERVKKGA